MADQYVFHISESYTPATIPMERLAEYMGALAKLLGETANVHFSDVFNASTALRANVDSPAQPKVFARVSAIRAGDAPVDAVRAFEVIDEMLRKDNAYGTLTEGDGGVEGAVIIPFPGKRRPPEPAFGPFKKEGTLDGEVYRIGGKDETKHVGIRDGKREYNLVTSEAVALELRHHAFSGQIRFHGTGTWYRHADGEWELRTFKVKDFDVLDDAPLSEVIDRLRKVPSDLRALSSPVSQLLDDRSGMESRH
ncbi:hypothetical protein [Sphingobium indicum]|nr:hypothetical protein [Sphingobium indicum]